MAEQEAPDWDVEMVNQFRQDIMDRFQCSPEEAAIRLRSTVHNLLEQESAPPQRHTPLLPPSPQIPPISLHNEEQPPHPKKKVFIDFDVKTMVSDRVPHNPGQYAVGRIADMEYVELWYFTTEGCKEASTAAPTTTDNTFSILSTASGLALQSTKATKASRNAINDEHLTWEQIMTARHTLIATASKVGWPQKHTLAHAQFYINLEGLKAAGYNPRALILYHAVVRRQWHETMCGQGDPFDLSNINEKLLVKLENQIRDHDQEELQKKASNLIRYTAQPYSPNANPPPTFLVQSHFATQRNATYFLPRNPSPTPRHAL